VIGRKEDRNKKKKLKQADLKMALATKECKQYLDMLIWKI